MPEADSRDPDSRSLDTEAMKNLALFVPRLVKLVGKLVVDPEVRTADKLVLGAALLYVASPIDLLPDMIPGIGQLDDLYLLALGLLRLLNASGEDKLREHWDGPEDIVALLRRVTDATTRVLPPALRERIRSWLETRAGAAGESRVEVVDPDEGGEGSDPRS